MLKYTLIYTLAHVLLLALLAGIMELLNIDFATVSNYIAAMGASGVAAWRFTDDHRREPTLPERRSYAWQALLASWLVSLLLLLGFATLWLTPAEVRELREMLELESDLLLVIAGVAALVVSLLYYLAIRWSFGWHARLMCKA